MLKSLFFIGVTILLFSANSFTQGFIYADNEKDHLQW